MNVYAAIIGGGAAGLMCAVKAADKDRNRHIVIIESADRVGKKILVSGNGRCNLSHLGAGCESYHGEGSSDFINILFKKYNPDAVLGCFHSIGLLTKADSEKRVYPLSNQSSSVLDVLRKKLRELNVDELCNTEVKAIKANGNGYKIICSDTEISAEKLVVATGGKIDYTGKSSKSAGLLDMLKLNITPLSPSLSPIKVGGKNTGEILRPLKGIRAFADAKLIIDGKTVKEETGEVQFTESALSGICIFNLSREANKNGGTVSLNLLPGFSKKQVEEEIFSRAKHSKNAQISEIFTGMFHKNIGLALLKTNKIKPTVLCKNISDRELKNIAATICDWKFPCEKSCDFRKSQVTAGGVRLKDIDPRSFRVKSHKNLYIIGEALDIDGDCGGYNLQFAFASGMCAGDSI